MYFLELIVIKMRSLWNLLLLMLPASEDFNPWDHGYIGVKLGTKHVMYQKLANFT